MLVNVCMSVGSPRRVLLTQNEDTQSSGLGKFAHKVPFYVDFGYMVVAG